MQEEPAVPDEFTFTGTVEAREESRHIVFVSGSAAMSAKLTWTGPGDLRLRIYDPDGQIVAEVDDSSRGNRTEEITINVGEGDWKVAAKSDSRRRSLDYTIEVVVNY